MEGWEGKKGGRKEDEGERSDRKGGDERKKVSGGKGGQKDDK